MPGTETDPDWVAYQVVQAWPETTPPAAVTVAGANLGHAIRRPVMLAVAAVLRSRAFPEDVASEASFLTKNRDRVSRTRARIRRAAPWIRALPDSLSLARALRQRRGCGSRPLLLVQDSVRLNAMLTRLQTSDTADILRVGTGLGRDCLSVSPDLRDLARGAELPRGFADALVQGLATRQIDLDARTLNDILAEARREALRLRTLARRFQRLKPTAILLHDDTTPTGLTLALAANAQKIPTVTVAHGLDCERFFLDAVYASRKCVWGPARAARIQATAQASSLTSGEAVRVTGNPAFDGRHPPSNLNSEGDTWLWTTRPHVSRKAFQPSRLATEGMAILNALLRALHQCPAASLTIKAHPTDDTAPYHRMIQKAGLSERVHFDVAPLDRLMSRACVVISEDSTAALDACFAGKPLVHSHFAPCPPVLPLAVEGAALPGYSPDELVQSVIQLDSPDRYLQKTLLDGQRAFIEAQAGPLDGNAGARVQDVLVEVMAINPTNLNRDSIHHGHEASV